jgi:hypothetical protein
LQRILSYLADDLEEYEFQRCEGIAAENHIGESLLILLCFLRQHAIGNV